MPYPKPIRQPNGVQELAVNVQLQVVRCAITDANRAGARVSVQVVEDVSVKVRAAVDPVHDFQWPRRVTYLLVGAVAEPASEGFGLVFVAESQQRM